MLVHQRVILVFEWEIEEGPLQMGDGKKAMFGRAFQQVSPRTGDGTQYKFSAENDYERTYRSEIHGHWSLGNINAFTLAGSYFTPKEHQHFPAATFHALLKWKETERTI